MKKTLLLLLTLVPCFLTAQHVDLVSQRWFVQNVTINGTTTNIPNEPVNFPFIDFYIFNSSTNLVGSSNTVINSDCQVGFTGHLNFISTNVFNFNDFTPFSTTTACDTSIPNFMNLYVNFYNDEITEGFTYTITSLAGIKTLIVTNNFGNQLEYTSKIFEIDPDISSDDWVLTELIIDNISYLPPVNSEVNTINIFFNDDEEQNFSTSVCAGLFGMHNFNEATNQFYIYELITTLNHCGITQNLIFENLYLGFFWNNLTNPFNYQTEFDSQDPHNNGELVITDVLGNQAIYNTFIVGTEDYTNSLFNIYPNPVKDNLIIEEKTSLTIENIVIYNYLGEKLFTIKNKIINMSHLEAGLYVVKIKLQNGKIAIKKIIKS